MNIVSKFGFAFVVSEFRTSRSLVMLIVSKLSKPDP